MEPDGARSIRRRMAATAFAVVAARQFRVRQPSNIALAAQVRYKEPKAAA